MQHLITRTEVAVAVLVRIIQILIVISIILVILLLIVPVLVPVLVLVVPFSARTHVFACRRVVRAGIWLRVFSLIMRWSISDSRGEHMRRVSLLQLVMLWSLVFVLVP